MYPQQRKTLRNPPTHPPNQPTNQPTNQQARCIAAKSPRTARVACFIAGTALVLLAVPFGMLGGLTRKYFGPDSPVRKCVCV